MSLNKLAQQIKAYLFFTQERVSLKKLERFFDTESEKLAQAVEVLESSLEDDVFVLIHVENSIKLALSKEFGFIKDALRKQEIKDLTNAQEEALSCVAYMAPVEKFHIDFIRGVNSRAVLRNLSTRGLVKKNGETYRLSDDALAHLGVTRKEELPDYNATREKLIEFSEANDLVENT